MSVTMQQSIKYRFDAGLNLNSFLIINEVWISSLVLIIFQFFMKNALYVVLLKKKKTLRYIRQIGYCI